MTSSSMKMRRRQFLTATGAAAVGAAGLAITSKSARAQSGDQIKLRIGYQFGLVYAQILLMKELSLIEKYAPGASIEYLRVASGAVVRDQIIAKQLDIGVLGPPPFLIGWQKLNWKYLAGTGVFPYQLVTWRKEIKSLKNITPDHKIAVPGPGSLQHILLAMAAEKELGDARALDKNLVSLPHPDAAAAILSKNPSVSAHFANIPFLFRELDDPDVHPVVDGFDAFGGKFMSPLVFMGPDFEDENPQAVGAFMSAYSEATAILNLEPERAAKALAPSYKQDEATVLRWLTWPGMTYTAAPYGIMGWHKFMEQSGYIKKSPESLKDICSKRLLANVGLEFGDGENPIEKLQQRG